MIYVANYETAASFDAEQDDPSMRGVSLQEGLDMMASPQLASVAMKMTSEWVDQLKADLFDEVMECMDTSEETKWVTKGWNEVDGTDGRRSNQVWDLMDGEELLAKLVVQRVPVSEI